MKKSRKILYVLPILAILAVALFAFAPVYADVSINFPDASGNGITEVNKMVDNVWSTVLTIVQILAFAAIVFAGVRYMFASADQKADIKKGLIYLVIGAILVFASSTVVKIIVGATNSAANGAVNVGGSIEAVETVEIA